MRVLSLRRAAVAALALVVTACGQQVEAQFNQPPLYERPAHLSAGGATSDTCWISADYLAWQLDGVRLPAVVTGAPAGTPLATAGQLGQPTTTILAGNETVGDGFRNGLSISGGIVFDPCSGCQIVADYFWLGDDDYDFAAGPNTGRIITRPFFNAQTGLPDTELVDVPNELAGQVRIGAKESLEGGGAALSKSICYTCDPCSGCSSRLSVVGGYRHYEYDSRLQFAEDLLVLPGTTAPLVPGTTFVIRESFEVKNSFNGGEIGFNGRLQRYEWWIDGLAMFAFGENKRTVTINGTTITTVPNVGSTTANGGLLTAGTNIGRYEDSDACIIPRFRLGLGCQVTQHLSAKAGYNLLVLADMMQSVDALPTSVDPRNLPPVQPGGTAEPAFRGFFDDTILAHGLDVGLIYSY